MCPQCTVQRLETYGMHVKITDHIKGLVPRIHLADVTLTNPEKKFKKGFRIKCRVRVRYVLLTVLLMRSL